MSGPSTIEHHMDLHLQVERLRRVVEKLTAEIDEHVCRGDRTPEEAVE